jgi:Protein of unknown function (DUF1353)
MRDCLVGVFNLPACALLCCYAILPAAASDDARGKFAGSVIVEWLEDKSAHQRMKLLEDFAFEDARGRRWVAPKHHVIDASSIPPVFRSLIGPPFDGAHRKAAVLHDYYASAKAEAWKDVRRMFFDASRASGIAEVDAKVMYMALYAEAPRWEPRSSSCFNHCHAARSELVWRPVVAENELRPIVEWIDRDDPTLDQIEEKVNAVTKKPGPHLFAQGHEPMGGKP